MSRLAYVMPLYLGKLIHHTATLVPSLNAVLVYGGRASPSHPNPSCYLLRLDGEWAKVDLDPTSHMPDPRWRHAATLLEGTGKQDSDAIMVQLYSCRSNYM